ncbi:hypothetical protein TRVL_10143 [Trypanosoma vivax]|nr:hypothetical protein TRVL_10143 [Trypanosoma vivax]
MCSSHFLAFGRLLCENSASNSGHRGLGHSKLCSRHTLILKHCAKVHEHLHEMPKVSANALKRVASVMLNGEEPHHVHFFIFPILPHSLLPAIRVSGGIFNVLHVPNHLDMLLHLSSASEKRISEAQLVSPIEVVVELPFGNFGVKAPNVTAGIQHPPMGVSNFIIRPPRLNLCCGNAGFISLQFLCSFLQLQRCCLHSVQYLVEGTENALHVQVTHPHLARRHGNATFLPDAVCQRQYVGAPRQKTQNYNKEANGFTHHSTVSTGSKRQ